MSLHVFDLYDVDHLGYDLAQLIDEAYVLLDDEDQRLALILNVIVINQTRSHRNDSINQKRQRMFFYTMGLVKLLIGSGFFLLATGLLILIS